MAAGVGVMFVRPRRAVRSVATVIALRLRIIVGVVMSAACRGLLLPMVVVQREHTTAEPGNHAEHQKPCKPTAHADQETPRTALCKPNLAGMGFPRSE